MEVKLNCSIEEQLKDPNMRFWLSLVLVLLNDEAFEQWIKQMGVKDQLSN